MQQLKDLGLGKSGRREVTELAYAMHPFEALGTMGALGQSSASMRTVRFNSFFTHAVYIYIIV